MTATATPTRTMSYREAINDALRQEMRRDPKVILMGEDVTGAPQSDHPDHADPWGGPLGVTRGLVQEFGRERVRDTPITESGFVGAGVGAAATGLRPVVELMFIGFMGVCLDQIVNQAVDRMDALRPGPGRPRQRNALGDFPLLSHDAADPVNLICLLRHQLDEVVEGISHLARHARPFHRQPDRKVPLFSVRSAH